MIDNKTRDETGSQHLAYAVLREALRHIEAVAQHLPGLLDGTVGGVRGWDGHVNRIAPCLAGIVTDAQLALVEFEEHGASSHAVSEPEGPDGEIVAANAASEILQGLVRAQALHLATREPTVDDQIRRVGGGAASTEALTSRS